MAEVHGSEEVIFLSGGGLDHEVDITEWVDTSTFTRTRMLHEVTTKGNGAVRRRPGLRDLTYNIGGVFDDDATDSPRVYFEDNDSDEPFVIERRIAGSGASKSRNIFNVYVGSYEESSPVAEMVRWSVQASGDGEVDNEAQS